MGIKFHESSAEGFTSVQLLLLDDDGTRLSCTILSSASSTVIVPHGREIMEVASRFVASFTRAPFWLQIQENGGMFICQFSKIFCTISQQLSLQVSKASQLPLADPWSGNFAILLGKAIFATVFAQEAFSVEERFHSLKSQKFPAENILLSSFILDYAAVQEPNVDINVYLSHVQRLLSAADSEVGSDESRKVVKKWRHQVSIGNAFRGKFPAEAEVITMDAISPDQLPFHLEQFLAQGKIAQVLFLLSKLDVSAQGLHIASAPLGVHADHIVRFVVWQRAHHRLSDRDQQQLQEMQTVESLYHRAESIVAERRGKEAITLLDYGLRMVQEQDCSVDTATWKDLRTNLQTLLFATKIVVHCEEIFGVEYSLEEVHEAGIEGIVFERLDSATALDVQPMASEAIPQLAYSLGLVKDDLLLKWLQTTIESSILNEDENDETFVIVEKLVYVSLCIEDAKQASEAALRLFQIPQLEKLLKRMGSVGVQIVERASDLCVQLTDARGEKLHEALRSYRLKVIAAKYGIEAFDIRDKNHVMMLVSIICNNRVDTHWVEDLHYCAYDRGMVRLELHSVLIRILVSEDADANESVELLRVLFVRLPDTLMVTVIDDAIKALVSEFNDVCDRCYPEGFVTAKTESLLTKHQQTVSPDSYIAKVKAFIDFYIDIVTSKTSSTAVASGSTTGVNTGTQATTSASLATATKATTMRLASCSAAMENLVSRIRNLHTEYDIYVSSKKLQSSAACKKVLEAFIKHLTTANANAVNANRKIKLPLLPSSASTANTLDDLPTSTFVHLQKIATLMHLSPQFAINEVLKLYLSLNKKKFALKLVYWNSEESLTRQVFASTAADRDYATSSVLAASTNLMPQHHAGAGSGASATSASSLLDAVQDHEGWNMLVNQALSLNTAALKHNKTATQYGYYATETDEQEDDFEKNAFASSAKILSDAILDCDENSLCTALDCFDGLLMQQEASIPLLSAFCVQELQRRAETTCNTTVFAKKPTSTASTTAKAAVDIERLVEYFQKTENHMLALQVLSQTWALDRTKAQLLKASLVALCRKLLTYRDINYDYAVACLSCLPMDTMFQELKMAVPTIQNDFSRLHAVALIGEELSFLCDQERQLELFQSLQSHAKWWHLLSSIGLKIDMKAFQHADGHVREVYVQSLIPSILQKSGLDLDLTLDYCRSFDVHPEYASLQYIELMLSLPPSGDAAQENVWIAKIASAASGLDERQLTTTLYRCLAKVHALDYERIMYFSFLNASHIQLTGAQKAMASKQPTKLTRQDVETCQKYIETIQYLSTLMFGSESIDLIKTMAVHQGTYQNAKGPLSVRIPFWTLTMDPWSVLTPVLTTASPGLMEKLLPLCYLLGIDKEEFTARSLHSMFQVKKRTLKDVHDEEARVELKRSFAALVEERAMLFTTKLKVWRLVFKNEKDTDKDFAIYALRHGLHVVEKVDEQRLPDIHGIRRALTLELTKLQVEDRIRHILTSSGFSACHQAIFALIDRPNVLLMKVLEAMVEHAWTLQTTTLHHASARGAAPEHAPRVAITQSPTLLVIEFLQSMRPIAGNSNGGGGGGGASAGNAGQEDAHGGAAASVDHFWRAEKQHPAYLPSEAEWRRREDAFFGFALICVLSLQTYPERRSGILQQLDAIMRGANRTLRRITTRSRYRAALAVHYFQQQSSSSSVVDSDGSSQGFSALATDTLEYTRYLYCLAEMHELRLTSTEMSLQSALGLKVVEISAGGAAGTAAVVGPSNRLVSVGVAEETATALHTRSLIITWLHDEGLQVSVVELARDLFFLAPKQDPQVLTKLFRHMLDHDLRRSVYTSLIWWETMPTTASLTSTLLYSDIAEGLVSMLWKLVDDSATKATSLTQTQLPKLLTSLTSSTNAASASLSWLVARDSEAHRQVNVPRIFEPHLAMLLGSGHSRHQRQFTVPATHHVAFSGDKTTTMTMEENDVDDAETKEAGADADAGSNANQGLFKSRFNRFQVTSHPRLFALYQSHHLHPAVTTSAAATLSMNTDVHLEELLLSTRHTVRWLVYFLQSSTVYSGGNATENGGGSDEQLLRYVTTLATAEWDFAIKLSQVLQWSSERAWAVLHPTTTTTTSTTTATLPTHRPSVDAFAATGLWQVIWPLWRDILAVLGQDIGDGGERVEALLSSWSGKYLTVKVVLLAVMESAKVPNEASPIEALERFLQETTATLVASGASTEVMATWVNTLLHQITGHETSSGLRSAATIKAVGIQSVGLVTEEEQQAAIAAVVRHCLSWTKPSATSTLLAGLLKTAMDRCGPADKKLLLTRWKQQQQQQQQL
eukprot:gene10160-7247_t